MYPQGAFSPSKAASGEVSHPSLQHTVPLGTAESSKQVPGLSLAGNWVSFEPGHWFWSVHLLHKRNAIHWTFLDKLSPREDTVRCSKFRGVPRVESCFYNQVLQSPALICRASSCSERGAPWRPGKEIAPWPWCLGRSRTHALLISFSFACIHRAKIGA